MSFFDKIFKQLFPQNQEEKKVNLPMVTEPIQRSSTDKSGYFQWVNEGRYKKLMTDLLRAYQQKLLKNTDTMQVHVLQTPYANGFALTYDPSLSTRHFTFLFDLLKDKVINLGYLLNISERRIYDKGQYVETKEKYYLKPPLPTAEEIMQIDQRYGNILIELVWIDQKPSFLKLTASIYSDRLYKEALPFEQLMDELFNQVA
jgi:hypothetical protein